MDTNSTNNTSGAVAIAVNCADVQVTKTTTTPIIKAGKQASYSITVTANGPTSSTHVVLIDTLPAGLNWTVGGPDKANCALPGGRRDHADLYLRDHGAAGDEVHYPDSADIERKLSGHQQYGQRERGHGHQLEQQHLRAGDDHGKMRRG